MCRPRLIKTTQNLVSDPKEMATYWLKSLEMSTPVDRYHNCKANKCLLLQSKSICRSIEGFYCEYTSARAIFVEEKFQISSLRIPKPHDWRLITPRWAPVSLHCSHVPSAAPKVLSASVCAHAHDQSAALEGHTNQQRGLQSERSCYLIVRRPGQETDEPSVTVYVPEVELRGQRVADGLGRSAGGGRKCRGGTSAQRSMHRLDLSFPGCAQLF